MSDLDELRAELSARKLSCRQLAKLTGVSFATISRFLRGGMLTISNKEKIKAFCDGVPIYDTPDMWKQCYLESLIVQRKLLRHIERLEKEAKRDE